MRRRTLALVAAGLLGASLGCASAPRFTTAAEQDEIAARLAALERRSAEDAREIAALRQRLEALASAPGHSAPTAPITPAVAPTPPTARVAASAARPAEIEESDLGEPAANAPATPGGSDYDEGLRLLRAGSYAAAEEKLRRLADEQPASDLADNAWFWIGESRRLRGDDSGAINAWRTTLERYPEGNKVPDAMLKLGVALRATGDDASAREVWSELLRRFPDSPAAESARSHLAGPVAPR